MDWFKNLKIRNKFFMVFGIFLFLVTTIVAFALLAIDGLMYDYIRITEGPNKRLLIASYATVELTNMRRNNVTMATHTDNPEAARRYYVQCINSYEALLKNLDRWQANLEKDRSMPDNERDIQSANLDGVRKELSKYMDIVKEEYENLVITHNPQRVAELSAKCVPIGDQLVNQMGTNRKSTEMLIDYQTKAVNDKAKATTFFTVILAVAILAFSLLKDMLISQMITSPIGNLHKSINEIEKGHLDYPIRLPYRDELGQLSNHIGDMVDKISELNSSMAILDHLEAMIFITDMDYNLTFVNNFFTKTKGLERGACVGQKCYKIVSGEEEPCPYCPLPDMFAYRETYPSSNWERPLTVADGSEVWFACRTSIIRWTDGSLALFNSYTDETVQKQHAEQLCDAARMAEDASRIKSSFLANMSHEIRTPMNAIVGMTELMLTTPLNAEQTSHALAVKSSAMSLLTIINDILDFSKLSAEKMEIINVPFDIASLINDTLGITNIKAQEAGLALTALISKDIPPQINGDEVRIRQCLLNLLGNAVKYTKTGGIALAVNCEHLDNGLKLLFSVKDSGKGMKEEEVGKIFGIFTRIDTKKNRNITGTGLGLAITKKLVEMMGGQISVESVYGVGSVFSFYITCGGRHEGQLAPFPEPGKYNVLAYEPNKYHARALRSMLLDLGVRHQVCRSPNDFKHQLQGGYTHVFYDKSAMELVQNYTGGGADFVLIKDMRDTNLNLKSMNRPILTTSLVRCLTGADGDGAGERDDEVRLGDFKTENVRALLVDDNPVNLTVAEGMLRRYNISVATALNGKEGLHKIQRDDFDIAFLDHMMPVMDGVEAAVAIRALGGRFSTLPLIALTANAMSDAQKMFKEAGMDGFIAKPIIVKELHNTLLKFLPEEKVRK